MMAWANADNAAVYENLPVDVLKKALVRSEIDKDEDLQCIYPRLIHKTKRLLEVGSGYGRAIDFIRQQGYQGHFTGVERSKAFFELLRKKQSENVVFVNTDIMRVNPVQGFDCILWLWCGYGEFSRSEQPSVLKKITSFLKPGGIIIIDSIHIDEENYGEKQYRPLRYEGPLQEPNTPECLHRYFPTLIEFKQYALDLRLDRLDGLELREWFVYRTTLSGVKKAFYIFEH